MTLPSVLNYRWHSLFARGGKTNALGAWTQFLAGPRSLGMLVLPSRLDRHWAERVAAEFENGLSQDALVVDFSQFRTADAAGLGMLVEGLRQVLVQGKKWYALGLSHGARRTLKMNRVWDLLRARICHGVPELVSRLWDVWPECRCLASVKEETGFVVLGFCGQLTGSEVGELNASALLAAVGGQNCLLDLSYCSELDSQGLALLVRLSRGAEAGNGRCLICNMTAVVEQTVKSAKLDLALPIVANLAEARASFAALEI
jgi:anti-anti-sigma regulatory factor